MGNSSALNKLLNTPDNLIQDDEHPNRKPILTETEKDEAGKELLELLKKKYGEKRPTNKAK